MAHLFYQVWDKLVQKLVKTEMLVVKEATDDCQQDWSEKFSEWKKP